MHQTGHPLENCRCQQMNFLFTKLFDCYCFNFRNLKGLHMFVKIFKLCLCIVNINYGLCESGKNFKLCLCKFFTSPHLSANVIPCLKCLATALATDNKPVLKCCRLGWGGGGGRGDRSMGRGCRGG